MRDYYARDVIVLSLRSLRQLVVLAEEANFTRAAERLGMTQPSLSRSIAELEKASGLRLFDRTRMGVTLTAAGEDLVTHARQIIGQVEAVEQQLLLQKRGEAGKVAIGMGPLAASFLLTRLLSNCLMQRPSLMITATADETSALIARVLEGSLDFCICAGAVDPHEALSVKHLASLRMGYFVRTGHPLEKLDYPLPWGALSAYPRAAGTRPKAAGIRQPVSRGRFGPLGATLECDDYEFVRQIMLRTDTIWLTSDRLLEQELAQGLVREIHPEPRRDIDTAKLVLVRLAGRSMSPAMRHVITTAVGMMNAQGD